MTKKIYQYDAYKVRQSLKQAFKERRREATVADLMAATALPKVQVDEQLPVLVDEFAARLRVTESGEVLYSFPRGFHSRYRGPLQALRRFGRAALKAMAELGKFLFKVWIVVMLVGYFVLFLALLVLFLIAGTASRSSDRDRRSSGGNLVGGLLNMFIRIWFYSEFLKPGDGGYRQDRAQRGDKRRPLHKAVFSFIFGDGDANADWPTIERKALLAFLQGHKGLICLEEFMILSGKTREEANLAMNAYCLEFEGQPEASDEGVVYYRFDSVLRRVDAVDGSRAFPAKRISPFSSNPAKANVGFALMNAVNFAFSGYFFFGAQVWASSLSRVLRGDYLKAFYVFVVQLAMAVFSVGAQAAVQGITVALGMVPLAFAILFYLIPLMRKPRLDALNERVKLENLRRVIYGQAWARPRGFQAPPSAGIPSSSRPRSAKASQIIMDELAADGETSISQDGQALSYDYVELERVKASMARLRGERDGAGSRLGKTIFDSET